MNEVFGYDKYLNIEEFDVLLCVDISDDSVYVIDAWDCCTMTMFKDNNIKHKLNKWEKLTDEIVEDCYEY